MAEFESNLLQAVESLHRFCQHLASFSPAAEMAAAREVGMARESLLAARQALEGGSLPAAPPPPEEVWLQQNPDADPKKVRAGMVPPPEEQVKEADLPPLPGDAPEDAWKPANPDMVVDRPDAGVAPETEAADQVPPEGLPLADEGADDAGADDDKGGKGKKSKR